MQPRYRGWQVAVAVLMFGLWVGLSGVAALPWLQHRLHSDSKDPTHQCLITQLRGR
jgi:hypothetical protein